LKTRITFLLFAIFLISFQSFSQNLFPVEENGKWGYINNKGDIIIKPQFDLAGAFSDGMALIILDEKVGYIDETGKMAVAPQFETASPFSEGLAAVMVDNKWGFINKKGRFLVEPRFALVSKFSNGLCRVKQTPASFDKWGFIDSTGNWAIGPEWDQACDFSEGLAAVCNDHQQYGYINTRGSVEIPVKYSLSITEKTSGLNPTVHNFKEGLAAVNGGNRFGYIDKSGKIAIDTIYEEAGLFSEGMAPVKFYGKYGYIDRSGKIRLKFNYIEAYEFSNGLAAVKTPETNGKLGFIDIKGNLVIRNYPGFITDQADPSFHGGLILISVENGWAYMNKQGVTIWIKK
jgi:hypothetical protein